MRFDFHWDPGMALLLILIPLLPASVSTIYYNERICLDGFWGPSYVGHSEVPLGKLRSRDAEKVAEHITIRPYKAARTSRHGWLKVSTEIAGWTLSGKSNWLRGPMSVALEIISPGIEFRHFLLLAMYVTSFNKLFTLSKPQFPHLLKRDSKMPLS